MPRHIASNHITAHLCTTRDTSCYITLLYIILRHLISNYITCNYNAIHNITTWHNTSLISHYIQCNYNAIRHFTTCHDTPHHNTPHMKSRRIRFVSHLITSAKKAKHTQYMICQNKSGQDRKGCNRTGQTDRLLQDIISLHGEGDWFYYLLHKERKSYHLFPVLLISTYVRTLSYHIFIIGIKHQFSNIRELIIIIYSNYLVVDSY